MLATRAEWTLGLPCPSHLPVVARLQFLSLGYDHLPTLSRVPPPAWVGPRAPGPGSVRGWAGSTWVRDPSLSPRQVRGPGGASALPRAGETYPPPAPPAGGGQGRARSLTSFPYSQPELGELLLPELAWGAERYAPRDFALLQLVLDYRGGVSFTSMQMLSSAKAFFQVIRFPTAF